MKKLLTILLWLALCLLPALASAGIAYPGAIEVRDADGQAIAAYSHGDEFFNYITDLKGCLIEPDQDGYYRYVASDKGDTLTLGERVSDGRLRSAGEGLRADAVGDLRRKLSALRAEIAAMPATLNIAGSGAARASAVPEDYNPNRNGRDPLNGHWVEYFTAHDYPQRADTCPLLVLKVEFDNVKSLFTDEEWHSRIFGANGVSEYYREVSDDHFTYVPATESGGSAVNDGVITVSLPIERPNYQYRYTEQNYSNGAKAGVYTAANGDEYVIYHECTLYAYAVAYASQYMDFSRYDRNGDHQIAPTELAVLVVMAGYEASFTSAQAGLPMTWAHSWTLNNYLRHSDGNVYGYQAAVEVDGVRLFKYTTIGENLQGLYDYTKSPSAQAPGVERLQATIGTSCHELGHDLGLRDLYDTSGAATQEREVGPLSLMAGGSWGYRQGEIPGTTPVHLDAYSKVWLGFYNAVTATATGPYAMTEAADSAHYNILRVNTDDPDIYYLVENRSFNGFDAGMPNRVYMQTTPQAGLAFWRIDDEVVQANWVANTINNQSGHYGIMPVYVTYAPDDQNPFRNSVTHAIQPTLALDSSEQLLACIDNTASTMNAWILPLELELDAASFASDRVPVEIVARLDQPSGVTPADLREARMDGALLQPGQYEVRSGSIRLALQHSYLGTLPVGAHSLVMTLNNGFTAKGTLTVTEPAPTPAPRTGDAAQPLLWAGLAGIAVLALLTLALRARRKARN